MAISRGALRLWLRLRRRVLLPADLGAEKVVSDSYRFIWVGIPKVATRSLLAALVREPTVETGGRVIEEELWRVLSRERALRDYFKFAFVRNPWSRVVSCYADKILHPTAEQRRKILGRSRGLKAGMPFAEFVRFLVDRRAGGDAHADRHWASQHLFITDPHGELLVDYLGRHESLEKDFQSACRQVGLPPLELPYLHTRHGWDPGDEARQAAHVRYYRDFYSAETRELVKLRYRQDIEMFDYGF
jgi:hypothetical protein